MIASLVEVFRKPLTWVSSMIIFFTIFGLMTLAPHLNTFLALKRAGVGGDVIASFSRVIFSNSTTLSLLGIFLVSVLTGLYIPILITYVRKFGANKRSIGGAGGTILGLFGIGCAACGSLLLTPLLGVLGVGGILAALPFGGEEFLLLGIIILITSIYYLLKKLGQPLVCPT